MNLRIIIPAVNVSGESVFKCLTFVLNIYTDSYYWVLPLHVHWTRGAILLRVRINACGFTCILKYVVACACIFVTADIHNTGNSKHAQSAD